MGLEENLNEARALVEALRQLKTTPLPQSIEQAASEPWSGAGDLVVEGLIAEYTHELSGKDACRVMPLKAAISILGNLEETMAQQMISDPGQICIAKLRAMAAAPKALIDNWEQILKAVKEAWRSERIVDFLLGYALEVVALVAIKKMIKKSFDISQDYEQKMRSRAFPQSSGKRFWRKRVSRQ